MLIATWVLAGGTTLLALTSLLAVITWRESRRRERDDQMSARILEAARKELAPRDEVSGLKDNLTGFGVLAAIIGVLVVWSRFENLSKKG